jgi:voltage-gated potassium channel
MKQGLKNKLHEIIFKTDTKAGRRFDIWLLYFILISILIVVIESVQTIKDNYSLLFYTLEWTVTIIFTLEYILRLYAAKDKKKYFLSYMGIIDLISFLPTYIGLLFPGGQYFLVVRGLRLLRVFRILKMANYIKEIGVLLQSIKNSWPKISIFMLFIIILVTILGSTMYVIEGPSNGFTDIPNSIYWAIVTLATVGYGDITPVSPLGKIIASVVILIGYGIIAVPTGIITTEIIKESRKQENKNKSKQPGNKQCISCQYYQPDLNGIFCSRCGTKL